MLRLFYLGGIFTLVIASAVAADKAPLPVADLKRTEPVDFNREVLPFLQDNCLSCHSQTTTKGGLNMETPELMLKGGETGPSVVPGQAAASLSFQAAVHQDADLAMPPRDNKAKAKNLDPGQLALLRLWIDQGAKASPKVERVLPWQPLPANLGAIYATALSPDGQFAACSRAQRLFIYHLPSGRCVLNEPAHRDQINALAFNPARTVLASAGYREVKLWRQTREAPLFTLTDAGSRLALSSDGRWLATGGEDGTVKIWPWPAQAAPRLVTTGASPIDALVFSPDGSALACASGKSLSLWQVASGEPSGKAETPEPTGALAWLPEGRQLITAGADGVIRVWSDALAPLAELKGHTGAVTALAPAGAGRLLSGGVDGTLRLWDVGGAKAITQMSHGAAITAAAARGDGHRFISTGENGIAKLWDGAGKPVGELRGNRFIIEHAGQCDRHLQVETATVAFRKEALSAAEKLVPAAEERVKKATETLAVKDKDLATKAAAAAQAEEEKKKAGEELAALEAESKKAAEALSVAEKLEAETASANPPDGDVIAKTKTDADAAKTALTAREAQRKPITDKLAAATKKAADAATASTRAETERRDALHAVEQSQTEVQQTAAGVVAAKTAIEAAEQARVHAETDLQAAKQAATAAERPIRSAAFSPDNSTVATSGDDGQIHTWSAENGVAFDVLPRPAAPVLTLAYTATGALLSAAGDRTVMADPMMTHWIAERTLGSGNGPSPFADRVTALAFSPDGELLATGGGEPSRGGELQLWDTAAGRLVRDFPRLHADTVLALAFSPDGQSLASGSADKLARVTDLATGKMTHTFEGHSHHVLSLAWSLNGRSLATASADNTVKVWDLATGERKKSIEGYEKEVTAVRYLGPSETLLTSSGDPKLRLVTAAGAEVRALPGIADFMECADVAADGKTAIAGGQDSVLRVWNTEDGKVLATFAK